MFRSEEQDGKRTITDDTRIRESLPTINYLREQGAKTILMAHFGRPKGKPPKNIRFDCGRISAHPDQSSGCVQSEATGKIPAEIVSRMKEGDVTLLENVRFILAKKRTIRHSLKTWPSLAIST
jgi:phosphoglycerate kinase